ncbi:MAG: transcriptional repressor [Comamonadaceae bacterium]|nr:transcriptional repressor [Comamonadaceae bacterium]
MKPTARTTARSAPSPGDDEAHATHARPPHGERATRQRAAIRAVLQREARPLSPPEVLSAAQQLVPGLGIATVYRNLKAMVEAGELSPVPLPGDRLYYELAHQAEHHHHHFRCQHCEKVFDVHGCNDTFARLLPEGFVLQSHDITLYGLCSACSGSDSGAAQ